MPTDHTDGRPRDTDLQQLLAVDVDTDRGESPFGWSDPTPTGDDPS